jgi:tRNA-uridine 2-sulfurtransferase
VKVVVGMSGGVDSSVAALLAKRAGHEVVGLFMKNWEDDDNDEYCSTREDLIDAAAAADAIGIDLEAVNFSAEYKERVFAEFLREYAAGRTPNPDVLCNAEIKFRAFLDHAMRLGAEKIATGHYARTDGARLLRGKDASKDQSYFLHRLTQEQLSRVMFPVGELKKTEVRRIALEAGLPNHAKKDSTGICFIGERPFREFLNRYLPKVPGFIVDEKNNRLGEHIGLAFYTIGQRKGIGIGGRSGSAGDAWYVADKRLDTNELVVVQGHDHPLLMKKTVAAADTAWVAGQAPSAPSTHTAKTRYRQPDAPCTLTRVLDSEIRVDFPAPQWAVTPGQSVVLYDGEVCLGGGVIT